MMWRTHAAITRSIGDALGMEPDLVEVMVDASVEPDRCPVGVKKGRDGRWARSRHHGTSRKVIKVLLWKARLAFLEGDVNGGSRALGLALHYVQDNSVPRCRNWKAHKEFERRLAGCSVPPEAINYGMRLSLSSPTFIDACVTSIRPRRDLEASMYQATAISTALASAILNGLYAPAGMERDLHRSALTHRYVVPSITIGVGTFAIVATWPFSPFMPITVLLLMSGVLTFSASKNRRVRLLSEWYDIS